jgi:ribosomal protein S18 acetylase RimI-like enzyme
MKLVPANHFSFEELTEAYNQTRVDYLVPMPMNVARLREYSRVYDINLANSCVAVEDNSMLGLGMLGVRENRAWITRLGVLPTGRRKGTGQNIMNELIRQAHNQKLNYVWLEVIKGNIPAHKLFTQLGFCETRELIVARRPPSPSNNDNFQNNIQRITSLDHEEAIILLSHRQQTPNWLNQTESLQNVRNLSALLVELHNGGRGWVTYHAGLLQLTRIIVEVSAGNKEEVTATILHALHQRHTRQDAIAENLCEDDQWKGFQKVGYFDSFRRVEMVKEF